MPELKTLQRMFHDAVVTGKVEDATLLEEIVGGDLTAAQRLQIHQNNYRESLSDALRTQFPISEAFVGEEFLKACAVEYIRVKPPEDAALVFLARGFAAFLKNFKHASSVPYLSDLIGLEWAVADVQNRRPGSIWQGVEFRLNLLERRIKLASHVELIHSDYPILQLWMVANGQLAPAAVHIDGPAEAVLVALIEGEVQMIPLTAPQKAVLENLDKDGGNYPSVAISDEQILAMSEWPVFTDKP